MTIGDYPPLELAYDADQDPLRAPDAHEAPGKLPPHDLDAESAVISAVFLDGTQLAHLAGKLQPAAFYSEAHRRMWEAAIALYDAGQGVDVVTVARWLKDHNRIEQVGGLEGMTKILDAAPVHSRVFQYAKIVHDLWRTRRVISTSQRVAAEGYLPIEDAGRYAAEAWSDLDTIARDVLAEDAGTNADVLVRTVRDISQRKGCAAEGMPSGFPSVDLLTGGDIAGRLTIIGALRGRGKTTYARQSAAAICPTKVGVYVVSTEQSRDEWLFGMLALVARVDFTALRTNRLDPAGWGRVHDATREVSTWPLFINDTPDITPNRIIQAVRSHLASRRPGDPRLGKLIIDHLHRLSPDEDHARLRRYEQLQRMTKRLKDFARTESLPIDLLAQQKSLKTEKCDDPKPRNDSIAESRAVEFEADNVLFLWRKLRSKFDEGVQPRPMLGVVTKARFGKEGEVDLDFYETHGRFDDVAALNATKRTEPDRSHVDPLPEDPQAGDPPEPWYERDDT